RRERALEPGLPDDRRADQGEQAVRPGLLTGAESRRQRGSVRDPADLGLFRAVSSRGDAGAGCGRDGETDFAPLIGFSAAVRGGLRRESRRTARIHGRALTALARHRDLTRPPPKTKVDRECTTP